HGVVGEHGSDSSEDGGAARAPLLHVLARRLPGDPAALTGSERRTAVEAHRELHAHPGAPLSHALHESAVELERLALEKPSLDFDAPFAQRRGAASVDLVVVIGGYLQHVRYAR